MRRDRFLSDPRDRARSAAATVAIHLALGTAFLTGLALRPERRAEDSLKTFNVPPLPPQPPIAPTPDRAPADAPAPAGRKADASPIVAPPARLPSPQPIVAAPVAGIGSSSNAGAAVSGSGTGAGGVGDGIGSGGDGGGGGITGARLLSGALDRRDYRRIADLGSSRGSAELLLLINKDGRVERCRAFRSSGNPAVDDALCRILIDRARFEPAQRADGTFLYQDIRYFPRWDR